ncbi:MAG TPA: glycosyltransferase [Gemmatimonadaceae bacterium]
MSPPRKLIVLLPVFNEELGIGNLLDRIRALEVDGFELTVVAGDDGSRDGTAQILARYTGAMPLQVITHPMNRGLGETVRDLFERAAALVDDDDVVVRLDADDTHDPAVIPAMIARIDEGADVVVASRFSDGGGQLGVYGTRRFLSSWANLLMKLVFPIPGLREYTCGFRAYRGSTLRRAIDVFGNDFIQLKGLGFTSTLEKLVKLRLLGARFEEVPFVLRYDLKASESKMLTNITTLGYLVMTVMYYWPSRGWRTTYRQASRR